MFCIKYSEHCRKQNKKIQKNISTLKYVQQKTNGKRTAKYIIEINQILKTSL